MLQNACLLAKIGADTAENERSFAKIRQKLATTPGNYPKCGAGFWHPRHVQVEELRVLLEVLAPDAAARGVVAERVDVGEEGGARRRRA